MSTTCSRMLYVSRDLHEMRSKDNLKALLTRGSDENKIDALWQIVKETGMGINHESLLLTLTMVIPNTKDKKLILLFYLYLENIDIEDSEGNIRDEILMICNMIRGHLNHPNEHVRARAIRAVGKLKSAAIFDVLKQPFVENITYTNPFVRTAVYVSLRGLLKNKELSGIFADVIPLLKEQVLTERDPICSAEGYKTLEEAEAESIHEIYEKLKESAHDGLQECFLKSAEKMNDAERIMEIYKRSSSRAIELESAILLVKIGKKELVIKEAVEKLLEISNEYLDAETKGKIVRACQGALKRGEFAFEGMGLKIAHMITPAVAKVNIRLARSIFQFVMEILAIVEARELYTFLFSGISDTSVKDLRDIVGSQDKIFFLQALKELLSKYKLYTAPLVDLVVSMLSIEIPELALEAAEYLDAFLALIGNTRGKTVLQIISRLPCIKYGKILRRVFGLLSKHADKETSRKAVQEIFKAFSSSESGLIPSLKSSKQDVSKIFPGVPIASFLLDMCRHLKDCTEEEKKAFSVEIMSTALKAYAVGYKSLNLDESSKVALLRLSNLLGSGSIEKALELQKSQKKAQKEVHSDSRSNSSSGVVQDIYARPVFSLIREKSSKDQISPVQQFAKEKPSLSLNKLKNVFQLTSAIDPLYCECQITTTRTEISLDILLVNQTDMLLENIEFDIVTSPNIKMMSVLALDKLRPHMMCTLETTLIMEESDTGYIGGVITAGKVGRDNYFIQNLLEIVFNMSDMLQAKKIAKEEFKERWPSLLWENLYTISLSDPVLTPQKMIKSVAKAINGTVIDTRAKEGEVIACTDTPSPEILVKNIYTTTAQGTEIFINATVIRSEEGLTGTFRIRGEKCRVVKSLCQLISKRMKTLST
ncbi:coatomer subunit beta [Nematocida minor]|uniref:coatomer subunit beta n=1 Tax=Nematocida minor TaxID=1912983 RepID=UPI00221E85A4|nr:coatomer subunit beta [Nematocida minor]KAI5189884.1 coatomer subunit beta [Nematocida minor]